MPVGRTQLPTYLCQIALLCIVHHATEHSFPQRHGGLTLPAGLPHNCRILVILVRSRRTQAGHTVNFFTCIYSLFQTSHNFRRVSGGRLACPVEGRRGVRIPGPGVSPRAAGTPVRLRGSADGDRRYGAARARPRGLRMVHVDAAAELAGRGRTPVLRPCERWFEGSRACTTLSRADADRVLHPPRGAPPRVWREGD